MLYLKQEDWLGFTVFVLIGIGSFISCVFFVGVNPIGLTLALLALLGALALGAGYMYRSNCQRREHFNWVKFQVEISIRGHLNTCFDARENSSQARQMITASHLSTLLDAVEYDADKLWHIECKGHIYDTGRMRHLDLCPYTTSMSVSPYGGPPVYASHINQS